MHCKEGAIGFRYSNITTSDVIEKLKVQSCRRRSARLDKRTREAVIHSNHRSQQEKINHYYRMLEEKKAQEIDAATRKKRVIFASAFRVITEVLKM